LSNECKTEEEASQAGLFGIKNIFRMLLTIPYLTYILIRKNWEKAIHLIEKGHKTKMMEGIGWKTRLTNL